MKKKTVLFAAVALVAAIIGISIYKYSKTLEVKSFNVSDFEEYIESYNEYKEHYEGEYPEYLSQISDAETLRAAAEDLWLDIFGKEMIKDEKPYMVFYDDANDVWYIRGYHEKPSLFLKGGVSHLIMQSDGKVLALWHDKD